MEVFLRAIVAIQSGIAAGRQTVDERLGQARRNELGEGVISAAIAVLVIAIIGAAMYAAFNGMFTSASDKAKAKVDSIGG